MSVRQQNFSKSSPRGLNDLFLPVKKAHIHKSRVKTHAQVSNKKLAKFQREMCVNTYARRCLQRGHLHMEPIIGTAQTILMCFYEQKRLTEHRVYKHAYWHVICSTQLCSLWRRGFNRLKLTFKRRVSIREFGALLPLFTSPGGKPNCKNLTGTRELKIFRHGYASAPSFATYFYYF